MSKAFCDPLIEKSDCFQCGGYHFMGDQFVADVQYNDVLGTAAFDGHDGPPLYDLAQRSTMPEGYSPVGFELCRLDPDESGQIPFTIVAVRCAEAGRTLEEFLQFERDHDELPVYRFHGKIDPKYFASVFKRVDIKALARDLGNCNVVAHYPEDAAVAKTLPR